MVMIIPMEPTIRENIAILEINVLIPMMNLVRLFIISSELRMVT